MSGSGPQLARLPANDLLSKNRSPLANLLHALNQPLTGLQCSLELAGAGPRSPEQCAQALREGLELTLRMRVLVEALRDLADSEAKDPQPDEAVRLDALLRQTAEDLAPVAETHNVGLQIASDTTLTVQSNLRRLAALMFRLLESVLSLTREGGDMEVAFEREPHDALLRVSWSEAPSPEYSPFSRPELGLLIAQVEWERAGGEWFHSRAGGRQTCTLRMPLASPDAASGGRCVEERR